MVWPAVQPRELHSDPHFELIHAFSHREMIPFLLEEWGRQSRIMRTYWAGGYLYLLALAVSFLISSQTEGFSWSTALAYWLGGSTLVLPLLVIVHEGLHALGYWLLGARNLSLGGNWRKAYIYLAAHHFVLDRNGFIQVALLPLVAIALLLLVALLMAGGGLWWTVLGVLGWHWMSCAGDVLLVSFATRYKKMYTYDDVIRSKTYFFEAHSF